VALTALAISATSTVETYPVPDPVEVPANVLPGLRHRLFEFLAPTDRVPLDRDWSRLLGTTPLDPGAGLVAYVFDLNRYLRDRFRYAPNATQVDTSLADFVAAGAGVGSPDGLSLVRELAQTLGAEMGATRAVVDAGWLAADHQIGQTGATVRPDLYIACGISGAVQHRVGMMDARTIVAINTDAGAPIFRIAHYKIVGDLKTVVPKLVKLLKA
jgi:hypothetical protein